MYHKIEIFSLQKIDDNKLGVSKDYFILGLYSWIDYVAFPLYLKDTTSELAFKRALPISERCSKQTGGNI